MFAGVHDGGWCRPPGDGRQLVCTSCHFGLHVSWQIRPMGFPVQEFLDGALESTAITALLLGPLVCEWDGVACLCPCIFWGRPELCRTAPELLQNSSWSPVWNGGQTLLGVFLGYVGLGPVAVLLAPLVLSDKLSEHGKGNKVGFYYSTDSWVLLISLGSLSSFIINWYGE